MGHEAGIGKDGAHHVQPLIQNAYAPEQQSGWMEGVGRFFPWGPFFYPGEGDDLYEVPKLTARCDCWAGLEEILIRQVNGIKILN